MQVVAAARFTAAAILRPGSLRRTAFRRPLCTARTLGNHDVRRRYRPVTPATGGRFPQANMQVPALILEFLESVFLHELQQGLNFREVHAGYFGYGLLNSVFLLGHLKLEKFTPCHT